MRYLSIYLIYAAIVARTLAAPYEEVSATPPLIFMLLLVYGLLLFSEPALTLRIVWYPWVYLVGQSLVVITMLFIAPQLDFLPTLFMPLSSHPLAGQNKQLTGDLLLSARNLVLHGLHL